MAIESSSEKKPFDDWPNDAGFNADTECWIQVTLEVQGRTPVCVAGTLYRTGPGHYNLNGTPLGEYKISHWFDGFTTVHRFSIIEKDDGRSDIRNTGKLDGISFGQKRDPCDSFYQTLKGVFEPPRSKHPFQADFGQTARSSSFAVLRMDHVQMKMIDLETLELLGVTDQTILHPELKGPMSGAHAQFDPENGDVFNYNLEFGKVCTHRVFKTSAATGKTEVLAKNSNLCIKPAYIHSFFLASDFVVLAVWSSHIAGYGISIFWERNILDALAPFGAKSKVKWLVIDRRGGRGLVATFESPAAFSFHSVNE